MKELKRFRVNIEQSGFTRLLDMNEQLSPDFIAGYNETKVAEETFPEGVSSVVSASVSGDSDDVYAGEAKVFVSITLNVSAHTEDDAKRVATNDCRLIAHLADILAMQACADIDLEEGVPEVIDVEEVGDVE